MLKSILFTHDDLDGAGCSIIYMLAHPKESQGIDYEVINCSIYPDSKFIDDQVKKTIEREDVDNNTVIYFADIIASREVIENLTYQGYLIRIFDHHRTNIPIVWTVPDAVVIIENEVGVLQSGTSLLYQHFCITKPEIFENNNLIALFVDTVRSYDTYEWKTTNNILAKQLQTLFVLLGMERFCKMYIHKLSKPSTISIEYEKLIEKEDMKFVEAKLENEQNIIDAFSVDDVFPINVRGYNAALIFSTHGANVSELANQFLTKHPEFDFMVQFTMYHNGEYSFRCVKENVDVSEIAKSLGGGGHRASSGCRVNISSRDDIIKIIENDLNR